jgi:hypothetical protein
MREKPAGLRHAVVVMRTISSQRDGRLVPTRDGEPPAAPVVRKVNPLEDPRWDLDLESRPEASIFHTASWARVMKDTYGFRPSYFTTGSSARDGALLPLMEVHSWLTGVRGVSLPFTDECPMLEAGGKSGRLLFDAAREYGRIRGWRYLECRAGREYLGDAAASTSFFRHRLEIRATEAELFSGVNEAGRRAIRKAEKSGLALEFSRDLGSVKSFYRLLCKTRRRHGLPVQPFALFANIQRNILANGLGWVVLARLGAVPVAGAVYLRFGHTATYKYGASDARFQHLRANNLVMWGAIKHFAQEGITALDFGRTSLANEGLRRFKLGFGARESRIDYVRFSFREHRFVTVPDRAAGWHALVFRWFPDRLLQFVGALAYKHAA